MDAARVLPHALDVVLADPAGVHAGTWENYVSTPEVVEDMKVLYRAKPGDVDPWYQDFVAALGDEFEIVNCAPGRPFAAQVQDAFAVVDEGVRLRPDMVPQAREAGVKLWQLLLEGYDQLDLGLFRANGELDGRTLGLIGLGSSGRALAQLCLPLGLAVVGTNPPGPAAGEAARLGIEVLGGPEKLGDLLSRADVVSIHVPLAPDTRHMIGPAEFEKMKPSAILINVARGQIVDQSALVDALRSQQIAGAGLDVFAVEPLPLDDPLLSMDDVVLTPHTAGATYETSRRRAAAAADNVQRVARGDKPLYVVT